MRAIYVSLLSKLVTIDNLFCPLRTITKLSNTVYKVEHSGKNLCLPYNLMYTGYIQFANVCAQQSPKLPGRVRTLNS